MPVKRRRKKMPTKIDPVTHFLRPVLTNSNLWLSTTSWLSPKCLIFLPDWYELGLQKLDQDPSPPQIELSKRMNSFRSSSDLKQQKKLRQKYLLEMVLYYKIFFLRWSKRSSKIHFREDLKISCNSTTFWVLLLRCSPSHTLLETWKDHAI